MSGYLAVPGRVLVAKPEMPQEAGWYRERQLKVLVPVEGWGF